MTHMVGEGTYPGMQLTEVLAVLEVLSKSQCRFWVGGGWGVDALYGQQTRAHRDLDLAVDLRDADDAVRTLGGHGYIVDTDWRPVRVELIHPAVGWVDLHPVEFDESGHGRQADVGGGWFEYPPGSFSFGSLAGVVLPCLSPRQQLRFRRGYELREVDRHDLHLLQHNIRKKFADQAQLLLVVGLPGSGKTTLARTLAARHAAVRLNPDEWMIEFGIDLFDETFRNRLEQGMITLAAELLALDGRVIIEFGSWSRRERDELLEVGRDAGAHVELHVLEPHIKELRRRLSQRNDHPGETWIDRPTLENSLASWESPDVSELKQYDAHHRCE
jgi:lincosamide nucleotidyltransferase A/C/D/E